LSLFQKPGNQSREFGCPDALMNPWFSGRKTHTFKCSTQKIIHPTKAACLPMFSAVLVFSFLSGSVHPSLFLMPFRTLEI